ncbi:8-oxo-dGTP diphosphatase MutT [Psychromonas aquatilis]|uniref:8-oxo-dGTP diphosphatase n=1 Tax=Psychromonas aquatilis TaxID=2005072 RepID=A0ABU9GRK4_9GAMM
MKKQNISIAIVQNEQQQLLISRRQKGQHLAGKWEFPGGKVAEGEAYELAMLRELKEEVGLTATKYKLFDSLQFDYDQLKLNLHFYLVSEYSGEAQSLEGQEVKWISPEQLKDYDFPEANVGVINKLL